MKDDIINIIISIFSLSFLQYKNIGMSSTQKTSCDRPLDSATPLPIKDDLFLNYYTPLFIVWMIDS